MEIYPGAIALMFSRELTATKTSRRIFVMSHLLEIQQQADRLSEEERAGLAAHLLSSVTKTFLGASDDEVDRRDRDLDSGQVTAISHGEFIRQVGRE